jgi:hypothetical protein
MDEINASYKQSLIREQLEEEHDLNREKEEWNQDILSQYYVDEDENDDDDDEI